LGREFNMPWSNQSGGGGGGQGPWGSSGGGGGGGPQPPDIEEMLRKGQDRLKSMIPGGGGSALGVVLVLAVVVAVWLGTGLYRVQADEQGVVLIFGKPINLTGPGLHYNFPSPIGDVIKPKVTRQNRVDVGYRGTPELNERGAGGRDVLEESLILTGDENIVDMDFAVLWRISNAQEYLFNLRDPQLTVKVAAESAMREVVGQDTFDRAVTIGRKDIEDKTRVLLQTVLDGYKAGILVEGVNLQKSDPPSEVLDAFNDVQRARQDRIRLQNEADAYANSIVPEARGLAQKDISEAEAYREQQIQEAQGEADRFTSVYNAYKVAPDVTRKRMYLETLGAVLGQARKVIIDQKGGGSGVVPYLPLPEVDRARRENSPQATN
jgi:modulator of FtsH protease HflK